MSLERRGKGRAATGSPPSSTSRRCRGRRTASASTCPATGSRSLNSDAVGVRRQRHGQPRARRRSAGAVARPARTASRSRCRRSPRSSSSPPEESAVAAAAARAEAERARRRSREPEAAPLVRLRSMERVTSASTATSISRRARTRGSRRSRASRRAYPYHDWNERITAECYAPNANARDPRRREPHRRDRQQLRVDELQLRPDAAVLARGEGARGLSRRSSRPTRESRRRFDGHGSALAQAYNHMILPLASAARPAHAGRLGNRATSSTGSGARPEGMWLPETAVDVATLEALAAEGIAFTILAPHQARRVRRDRRRRLDGRRATRPWIRRCRTASRCRRARRSRSSSTTGRSPAPSPSSGCSSAGERFAERLAGAFADGAGRPQLVHIATDGETYGHHHRHGDMALAYALHTLESRARSRRSRTTASSSRSIRRRTRRRSPRTRRGAAPTASSAGGATAAVRPGRTPGWTQAWRAPLREALDALRDTVGAALGGEGGDAARRSVEGARRLRSPSFSTAARTSVRRFLAAQAGRSLTAAERIEVLEAPRAPAPRPAHVHELRLVLRRRRRHRGAPDHPVRGPGPPARRRALRPGARGAVPRRPREGEEQRPRRRRRAAHLRRDGAAGRRVARKGRSALRGQLPVRGLRRDGARSTATAWSATTSAGSRAAGRGSPSGAPA